MKALNQSLRRLATRGLAVAIVVALALAATVAAAQTAPDALVKTTSDEVLAEIKQTTDSQKLLKVVQDKVVPHFDFQHMTQLAVGKAWKQASPTQQQSLEKEFRELLVRTYTNALAVGSHSKAEVKYLPFRAPSGNDDAVVKTQVIEPGKPAVAIDYRLEKKSADWKVFDVTVDSVSLVTNYRSTFATTVSSSGVDGLIKSLVDKNKSLQK